MTRQLLLSNLAAIAMVILPNTSSALDLASLVRERSGIRASMTRAGDECEDGYHDGYEKMRDYWYDTGSNCYNVWGLEAESDDTKEDDYPDSTDWRVQTFNECARAGVDEAVANIEENCLNDDSSQCTDLGTTAAKRVVMNHWCTPGAGASQAYGMPPDYKEVCKAAAVSICEGSIHNIADSWCSSTSMTTHELTVLQGMCLDQVDRMVGVAEGNPGGEEGSPGEGEDRCGLKGVDDSSPRPIHKELGRFRFNLQANNAKCADANGDLYEWGEFDGIEEFSYCAEACVLDADSSLLDTFRGYEWDCADNTCHCLYDVGTLDNRNSGSFARTNRNPKGEGSIARSVASADNFCAKLVNS